MWARWREVTGRFSNCHDAQKALVGGKVCAPAGTRTGARRAPRARGECALAADSPIIVNPYLDLGVLNRNASSSAPRRPDSEIAAPNKPDVNHKGQDSASQNQPLPVAE
jgi:hypothetical protein